jgi:hypothetical protein
MVGDGSEIALNSPLAQDLQFRKMKRPHTPLFDWINAGDLTVDLHFSDDIG